jgi:hypothetical protein
MIIDIERNKLDMIVNKIDEDSKIIKQINGIYDKRKRRSIHVTETRKKNIEFNGGQMINNCIRFFESSYEILNVNIDKHMEIIEKINANINVGDRIRSI